MNARDLLSISLGSLWRMKLRASLTVAGVVIAIGAFVALLSFGAGNKQHIDREFQELGLFSTMHVYPPRGEEEDGPVLDDQAVVTLATLPGVRLAYPFDQFDVSVALDDTVITTAAQALPGAAARTRLFSRLEAGVAPTDDSAHDALVTTEFLELAAWEEPDSIIGRTIIVSVHQATLDSALTYVFRNQGPRLRDRFTAVDLDSLDAEAYPRVIRDAVRDELNDAMVRFVDGFMNARVEVSDTLIVRGVIAGRRRGRLQLKPIIVPMRSARRFHSGGLSSDPVDLFAAMRSGTLLPSAGATSALHYPQITLDLDPRQAQEALRDTIEALGYRTFSYAAEFDQIRKFFLFFDLGLAAIGLVALVTASLGIANTMMMSITERRREIGVMAALGADGRAIRLLFLVESGLIGAVGASGGILLGWAVARVASAVARLIMERQGIETIELFATPPWLILTAFLFGLAVSVLAGLYPAGRAARVDPVAALRQD